MFYGGIAAGVVLIARAPAGAPVNLNGYLFGAINTVSRADLVAFAVLSAVVVLVTTVLRGRFFAVAQDEESGLGAVPASDRGSCHDGSRVPGPCRRRRRRRSPADDVPVVSAHGDPAALRLGTGGGRHRQ